MLRDGAAWHVPAHLSGQDETEFQLYASTETAAKNERRGIWGVPDLKPVWEMPARSSNLAPTSGSVASRSSSKPRGVWGDKNPRLGNIGPLVNGYNARTRAGYLSTSLLGIDLKDTAFDGKLAIDITYFYHENDGPGRTGLYVFTIASQSPKVQFLRDNNLWLIMGDKKLNLGRAERTATNDGLASHETLKYKMSKETLEKLVNNDEAHLLIGNEMIVLTGVRYMLYNMLQLTN